VRMPRRTRLWAGENAKRRATTRIFVVASGAGALAGAQAMHAAIAATKTDAFMLA
jgi:hypothetical protein